MDDILFKRCPHVIVAKVLNDIVVNEFEPQSLGYVHFWKNNIGKDMNPLVPLQMWVK